jgi:hypothetical protein
LIKFSLLPDAKYLLSGENAIEKAISLCPFSVAICFYKSALKMFIEPSPLPVANNLPSGENATYQV